jgi:uncharacterized protein with von Willebrand factor type A (vWA) domain
LSLENRARVEVFIPLREDDLGYQAVSQWVAEEFAFRRGGSTTTTAFLGLYASPTTSTLARDHVQIIFTDILVDLDDIDARNDLVAELGLLRMDLEGTLHEEEEIWVTISPIGIVRR